jgi:hypothetical protein
MPSADLVMHNRAVELFVTDDYEEASKLAAVLEEENT